MLDSQDQQKMPLTLESLDLNASPRAASSAEAKETTRLVKLSIRPEMLTRIPLELQDNVHDLVPALRKLATPFRLMDLPTELRLEILELALRYEDPVTLINTFSYDNEDAGYRPKVTNPPSITSACRKLREETLPIYYSLNTFRMVLNHLDDDGLTRLRVPEVKSWAGRNPVALQYLQELAVMVKSLEFWALNRDQDLPREVTVRYHADTGVELELSIGMKVPSLSGIAYDRLLRHEVVVERYRKARGLGGEAVALFFRTGRFDWDWMGL
ncbi:hypothetical protein LTR85_001376 [Meristemomyces frigidus]|nr:hypothetical protein LTR85_001376 [Meristemomyces frigidus]